MRDELLETNLRQAVPKAARSAGFALVELHPGYDCREHALTDLPWTIGRDPECELSFDDSSVSRLHARLELQDGQLVALDLGSTNGTVINRRRLGGRPSP